MKAVLPSLLVLAWLSFPSAKAGESYDNCTGFIDSVPATITTQGVWCLRSDLSTAISFGAAIAVQANNVTIDCNHFKLGGLAAGTGSTANGILSPRLNTAVRNCNIRGFRAGVSLNSDGGNLVESSRFDGNLLYGVFVSGAGSTVRGNQVLDTGGSTATTTFAVGIFGADGTDIIDNTVTNVFANAPAAQPYGIYTTNNGTGVIRDNRIRGIVSGGGANAWSIFNLNNGRLVIRGNDVQGTGAADSVGIYCQGGQGTAFQNVVAGQANAIAICAQSGNYINNN